MKKYIYSLMAFLLVVLCQAQVPLNQAEYFWDADPGQGLGIAVDAVDGNFNNAFEQLSKTGITAPSLGMHTFNIRIKNISGVWGDVFSNTIKVDQVLTPTPISILQAEYFWDTDPGEGSSIIVLATDGNFNSAFERLSTTGIAAPSVGLHTFNVRVKDATGVWGTVFKNVILVDQVLTPTPISISQAEYFWDTDPGEGSATVVLATDGNFNNAFEQLSKTGITAPSAGLHTFNIRIKDNTGVWGTVFSNLINVDQVLTPTPISISQAEYFWDTDPGEGSATALLASDGNFNRAFEQFFQNDIPIAQPAGLHVFNVRVKDVTGVWGPVFKNVIIIETSLCTTPVPTAPTPQFFCVSGAVSGLVATGTNLQWYLDSTGGVTLSNTTALVSGNYYVSQTIGVCESLRTPVSVTVNPIGVPTFTQVTPICSGAILAALPTTSTNGITGTWMPALNNTVTTLYTFTPTVGLCASTTTMTITVNPIVVPTFTQVTPICSGATLAALPTTSTNGITGTWLPALNNTVTTLYTFTPTVGLCASTTTMTISVNIEVSAPTGSANQTFCIGETVGDIIINGTSIIWYDAANLGNIVPNTSLLVTGTTYYASQTISSCSSNTRLAVTVLNGGCLEIENFNLLYIKVYPNPVKDILTVSLNKLITNISIFNVLGQQIITKSINDYESKIDMSRLSSGTYFTKIYSDNLVKTIKVIKE
ncbi:T9SS type A sorting domain-containing protein [Flavobacterium sp.]|uniref:T9SS type A sorting domain-containing protein n=1 Tax=Flavobacterium sp. TaxID=239 RepID=UPI00375361B2